MKKIIASAVGLMMLGGFAVTTANAFESKFGGYWRTRAFSQTDFKPRASQSEESKLLQGVDNDEDYWRVDNRTRLYYTAIFNEDFKFVNKFEFNSNWGDDNGGDIGADGMGNFRIKNSYADFNLGNVNTKIGIHAATIARGFIFDDDFSGITLTGNFGNVSVPLIWARVDGENVSAADVNNDILAAMVNFKVGDMTSLTPYFVYNGESGSDLSNFFVGIDADMNFDVASAWGTLIYQGGQDRMNNDSDGWLGAIGGKASIVHGQFFYASGDDDPLDGDNDRFLGVPGRSYYWSEIMGLGMFDNQASHGSRANAITNMWAANIGATFKPMDKLTLNGDLWYASLAEEDIYGNDGLGTEIDLKATYMVMDNLNLDVIFAYLFADDATGQNDPVEVGARLSLKF